MVRQFRSGRFGQPLQTAQQEQEEVTPEQIREEPRVPEGRFGRGLRVTEGLRNRATQLSNIRQEAIAEAQRLEDEFFSRQITTTQAEEEYSKVNPLVRQFIRTTPEVRRQRSVEAVNSIRNRIANEESNISRLQRGTDLQQLEALEKQSLVDKLKDLIDEAELGAFSFGELVDVAERFGSARRQRAEDRAKARSEGIVTTQTITRALTTEELIAKGIPRSVAVKINSGEGISLEEFYQLPKSFREQSGLTRADFEQEVQREIRQVPLFKNTPFVYNEKFQKFLKASKPYIFGNRVTEINVANALRREGLTGEKFNEEFNKRVRLTDALQTGFFASISGVPQLPKISRVPTTERALRLPKFLEIQIPTITKAGKTATLSQFVIKTETKVPSAVFNTKNVGGFLGTTPKLTKIIPSEIKLTQTVIPSINEGKVLTLTSTKGKKFFDVDVLTGVSRRIKPQDITGLTNTQKYLFGKATGSKFPVSSKNIGTLLGKNQELTLSSLRKVRLGRVSRPFNLNKLEEEAFGLGVRGKSTTRFEVASKFKPFGKNKEFNFFKGKLYFKDVTKDLARGSGKINIMKGIVGVRKQPLLIGDFKDVKMFKPFNLGKIKRTPLSLAFPRQELKLIPKAIIKLPKINLGSSKGLRTIVSPKISGINSLLLGGNSGSFDRARSSFRFNFNRGIQDFTKSKTSAQEKTLTTTRTIQRPKQDFIFKTTPKLNNRQLTKPIQELRLNQKLIPKLSLKQINKSLTRTPTPRLFFNPSRSPLRRTPLFFPEFKLKPFKLSRRRATRGRSDLALVESFTARELGLKPLRIRERDIGKALKLQANPFNIRRRPLIIPNRSRKKFNFDIPNNLVFGKRRKRRRR